MYGVILTFVVANDIVHRSTFVPNILKVAENKRKPEEPQSANAQVVYYNNYVQLVATWACPQNWHSTPVGYNIICFGINFAHFSSDITVQSLWNETLRYVNCIHQNKGGYCEFLWNMLLASGYVRLETSVDWRAINTASFWIPHSQNASSRFFCKVRAVNDHGASEWRHSSLLAGFSPGDSIQTAPFRMVLLVKSHREGVFTYVLSDMISIGGSRKIVSKNELLFGSRHNRTSRLVVTWPMLNVGCYDWVADQWYVAVNRTSDKTLWIALTETTLPTKFEYIVPLNDSMPEVMLCYPIHSTIVWSHTGPRNVVNILKVGRQPQILKLSDYTCPQCRHLINDSISSPAIAHGYSTAYYADFDTNGELLPDTTLVVQTTSGLWKIWLDRCKCIQLRTHFFPDAFAASVDGRKQIKIKSIVTTGPFDRFLMIDKSTNKPPTPLMEDAELFFFASVHSSLTYRQIMKQLFNNQEDITFADTALMLLSTGFHTQPFATWNSSVHVSRLLVFAPFSEHKLTNYELDYIPWFVAYEREYFPKTQKIVSVLLELQYPLPQNCMYPNVLYVMSHANSPHSVTLTLGLGWDESDQCKDMSRPKVIYQVKYRPWKNDHQIRGCRQITSCHKDTCPCFHDATCRRWSSGIVSQRLELRATLTDLEPETMFYAETAIEPDLGNYKNRWYGDGVQAVSYGTEFSSHYIDESVRLRIILLGIFVPFGILLLLLSSLSYYMYQRKWYVFQQIQRLNARSVKVHELVGEGSFGQVFKATLYIKGTYMCGLYFPTKYSFQQTVAVKITKPSASEREKKAFVEEAMLMSKLGGDLRIVRTMGICMDSRPMMLALEFLNGGSLNDYLRREEVQAEISPSNLLHISMDVARACHYLDTKSIVHRDLAARNCLVTCVPGSKMPRLTKITDFGLAKDASSRQDRIYQTDDLVFPIAHTAPEGFSGIFSSKSDVWSYAVVLWEVWSWIAIPFKACSIHFHNQPLCPLVPLATNAEVRHYVCVLHKTLMHWSQPSTSCFSNFSTPIKRIMELCWQFEPSMRPSFKDIIAFLKDSKSSIECLPLERPPGLNQAPLQNIFRTASSSYGGTEGPSFNSSHVGPLLPNLESEAELIEEMELVSSPVSNSTTSDLLCSGSEKL